MPRLMSPSSPSDATPLTTHEEQNAWDAGYEMASFFHSKGKPLDVDGIFLAAIRQDSRVPRDLTEDHPSFWEWRHEIIAAAKSFAESVGTKLRLASPAERLADMHLSMYYSTYVMTGRTFQNKELIRSIFGPSVVWDSQLKRWLGYGGGNGMDRSIWDLRRSGIRVTVVPGRLKPGEPIPDTESKVAADWSNWQNYNTIGSRKYLSVLLGVMGSQFPADWRVMRGTNPQYETLKSKWLSKGYTVDEKGVKGKKVTYRGHTMFIGVVGGTEMAIVDGKFDPGKLASEAVADAWFQTTRTASRFNWREVVKMDPEEAMDALEDLTRVAGRKAKGYLDHYRMEARESEKNAKELAKAWDKWDWDGLVEFNVVTKDEAAFAKEVIARYEDVSGYSRSASEKRAGGRPNYLGIDVRSVQDRTASWWDDMEKLIQEWWSFHKIVIKRSRGKLVAIVPGTQGRPVWEIDIRGPITKPTVYVGGAQKSFGPDANLLEDIMYWIDSITRP